MLLIWALAISVMSTYLPCQPHPDYDYQNNSGEPNDVVKEEDGIPLMLLPQPSGGLMRRKRAWSVPPIYLSENDRGPFPKGMMKVRSNSDKEMTVLYSITGPGADAPPVGVFIIDRNSGVLYVTKTCDREEKDTYLLVVHSELHGSGPVEDPMGIVIHIIDQNDNKPIFTQDTFLGEIHEATPIAFEIMTITATDLDEPGSANSDIRYSILDQNPLLPSPNMFTVDPFTGVIRVNADGLDRKRYPQYTLGVQAADMVGHGLIGKANVIITVTTRNDHAPQFVQSTYAVSHSENVVGTMVIRVAVTDGDEPHSPAWSTQYRIVEGDPEGHFTITTGPNKQEGIITTAKPLDFEKNNRYTLLVTVENDNPVTVPLPTSTATVTVNVEDVNEAPVFSSAEMIVIKNEDVAVGVDLVLYTASDPDTARKQSMTYRLEYDPAGWLDIKSETGQIKVKHPLDRESPIVHNDTYTALIIAVDHDDVPATGTGTLVIQLQDVNDNAPTVNDTPLTLCNEKPGPVNLIVTDLDGPGFGAPFTVEILEPSKIYCTAKMDQTRTMVMLFFHSTSEQRKFLLNLRVSDRGGLYQDDVIQVTMDENTCMTKGYFCVGPDDF